MSDICPALLAELDKILQCISRATRMGAMGHLCDRCEKVPKMLNILGSCYSLSPIVFGKVCDECVAKITQQIKRVQAKKHLPAEEIIAFVDTTHDIGTVVRNALETVRMAHVVPKSPGPTRIQCDIAHQLVFDCRKRGVGDCERALYNTVAEYKRAMAIKSETFIGCFCCRARLENTAPVYSLAGQWAMCVPCRGALIHPKPSSAM